VTVTSSNGQIKVQAKQEILLAAGGGYVRLAGGNIDIHCPASISVKGVTHGFAGPGSRAAALPVLPAGSTQNPKSWIEIERKYFDGSPAQYAPYKIKFADGSIKKGRLNEQGYARIQDVAPGLAKIEIGEDVRDWKPDDSSDPIRNPAYRKYLTPEQSLELSKLFFKQQQ
jgi:type VI secretion system secreted protein VgrG